MGSVTGLTSARMQQIINNEIVDADVIGDNLILTKADASTIDAGNVRGPQGSGAKGIAFPANPTDGDLFVRTDLTDDPLYKYSDGSWKIASVPTRVTALPANPVDGQEIYFVASEASGVIWHFRYNAASGSAYKWEFISGSDLVAGTTANEGQRNSQVYISVGPNFTLPLAGDWDIWTIAQNAFPETASLVMRIVPKFGAAAEVDTDGVIRRATANAANDSITLNGVVRKLGLAAGILVQMRAKGESAGTWYPNGNGLNPLILRARPVRVG